MPPPHLPVQLRLRSQSTRNLSSQPTGRPAAAGRGSIHDRQLEFPDRGRAAGRRECCVLQAAAAQERRSCAALHGDEFMIDFAQSRHMMVEGQVRTYDVTDLRVLAAMREVPREHFVREEQQAVAYADRDLTIGSAEDRQAPRYLLKPA